MKYFKSQFLILICSVLFHSIIFPQNHISFNHLNVEDGLSQSVVTCILQDDKGFMWFGTQDGLNRFDGYDFKVFRNDPTDSTTLKDNFIFSIYQSNDGPLYIETQQGNFHLYNPLTESFQLVNKDSVDLFNTRYNSISALYIDPKGVIWKGGGSRGIGLTREDSKTGEIITYNHNPDDKNSLSSDRVYSIYRVRSGQLWIGTREGLDILDEATGRITHFNDLVDSQNQLSGDWVWPIFEDSKGIMWISVINGGLNKFDPKTKKVSTYKNIETNHSSLSHNSIYSIHEDKSGMIWLGTNAGGINHFHPSQLVFEHFINDPNNSNSLTSDEILSALVDNEGTYWIGTRNGGLNKLNFEKKKFEVLSHDPKNENSLIDNSIQTLFQDSRGIIWIGTPGSGLDAYNPRTKRFTHYKSNPSDDNSLSDDRIYALLEDQDEFIWIGTYRGGLNRLNPRTGEIKRYQFDENNSTTISSNATWSMSLDGQGKLWIGTFGEGINILDPNIESFSRISNKPNNVNSLPDNNIIRVFRDSKDNIWIGSLKGLSKYRKESKNFKNYNTSNGLPNDVIYGIVEDDKGFLWISTNNGISKFDPVNETFKNYYAQDGLQGNEFNQSAFAKDHKTGRVLFGGLNGFNIFHPDSIKGNDFIPPIVLTNYIRYNTDDDEGKPIVEKGISEIDSIYLTYKDNIVNFQFSALSYLNNKMNQYRYKLEGFNENWIQLGNNHSITFTNLTADHYILNIVGSNNDGIWNEEGTNLFIEVSPPWWRSTVAYIIYGLMVIGILLGIRKVERNIHEQKAETREFELLAIAAESEKRALQVENDRKSKELEEAREMQLSMLPKEIPEFDNVEVAAFMRTATEVGGDYYDFLLNDEGTLNIAFGDATGHGLKAGTMVTLIKGFFTSYGSHGDIKTFFERSTKTIKEIKLGRILMAFSFLKINGLALKYSSVGMPPMYFYKKSSGAVEEIVVKGMPLGAMATMPFYSEIDKDLSSGDVLLLFSDGIPEQMNTEEQMYDYPRFLEKFKELVNENKSPQEMIDIIIESVDEWRKTQTQDDDITLMVIRVK